LLPLGVIGRTQERFEGIPIAVELTQHQLIVATALASDKTLFYAGLFHDILKPALQFFKTENRKWSWQHLNYRMGNKDIPLRDYLRDNQAISKLGIDESTFLDIIQCHHRNPWCRKKSLLKHNPINYVESKLGITSIEATLLPSRGLENIGLHVCLEARGLSHPYHYFVLTMLYHGLKYYLNRLYGEIFSKLGLKKLIVEYYFEDYNLPLIEFENNTLIIKYYVDSPMFRGLRIRHEYSSEFSFDMRVLKDGGIGFAFGWSDVLVYMVPYVSSSQYSYRIACVIPGLVSYNEGKIEDNDDVKESFKDKVKDILLKVINDLESSLDLDVSYEDNIVKYLEGHEQGNYNCLFCTRRTNHKIKLSRTGLLSEKFTDYHRISGSVEGTEASICPLCHLGFIMEEKFRKQGPSFLVPLAGDTTGVGVARDFADKFLSKTGAIPINMEEGVVLSILGHSTLQLISNAWYQSLLKRIDKTPVKLPWVNAYNIRSQRDIDILRLSFLISREVLLYPLIIKVRPRALISTYGGRNKKFVLNTDLLEGHVLWRGEESDLTEEQLDALKPILREIGKSKIGQLRKLYSRLVSLYGLR
jgi:hypothetical protein